MKNIIIIILLVTLFFGLLFGIYLIGFKYYFSSDRLVKHTKRISRITFQREVSVSQISLSPLGKFRMRAFAMAARGGFDRGTLISIKDIAAKIEIIQLFRRNIRINRLKAEGVNIYLNYKNKRKFNYNNFFGNVKYLFMKKTARQGIIKNIEIHNIDIVNGQITVDIEQGRLIFKEISLSSMGFNSENDFEATLNFVFEFKEITAGGELQLSYNKKEKIIYINNLLSTDLSLSADGKIKFLDDGTVIPEFVAKIRNTSYLKIIDSFYDDKNKIGFITVFGNALHDDDIIINYPRDFKNKKNA